MIGVGRLVVACHDATQAEKIALLAFSSLSSFGCFVVALPRVFFGVCGVCCCCGGGGGGGGFASRPGCLVWPRLGACGLLGTALPSLPRLQVAISNQQFEQ